MPHKTFPNPAALTIKLLQNFSSCVFFFFIHFSLWRRRNTEKNHHLLTSMATSLLFLFLSDHIPSAWNWSFIHCVWIFDLLQMFNFFMIQKLVSIINCIITYVYTNFYRMFSFFMLDESQRLSMANGEWVKKILLLNNLFTVLTSIKCRLEWDLWRQFSASSASQSSFSYCYRLR